MSARIKIDVTTAVGTFGGYYPQVGDVLLIDSNGVLSIEQGFEELGLLDGVQCTEVESKSFVSPWLSLDTTKKVQVVIKWNEHFSSLIFIWMLNNEVESSGISTGGGN